LNAKHRLIVGGIGWGSMPEPVVRADIEAGRLVRLSLRDWLLAKYPMKVVHKADTPPGPAGRWLIERLMTLSDGDESRIDREVTKPAKAQRHRGQGEPVRDSNNRARKLARDAAKSRHQNLRVGFRVKILCTKMTAFVWKKCEHLLKGNRRNRSSRN
jgi:hypothetical protein